MCLHYLNAGSYILSVTLIVRLAERGTSGICLLDLIISNSLRILISNHVAIFIVGYYLSSGEVIAIFTS